METLQAWAVLLFMAVLVLVGAAHGAERREVKKRRKDAIGFEPEAFESTKSRSSARWATDKLLKKAGLFGGKGLRIGYAPESGRLMRWNGDAHACLIAPTGMGKGPTFSSRICSPASMITAWLRWTQRANLP